MSSSFTPTEPLAHTSSLTEEERVFIEQRAETYTDIVERFEWLEAAAEMIECARRSRDEAFRRS